MSIHTVSYTYWCSTDALVVGTMYCFLCYYHVVSYIITLVTQHYYVIVILLHEEYHAKGKKLYLCCMDLEKAFDIVPRKLLEWSLRKKDIQEVLVRSVMSLYDGARTMVRVDSELSE